MWHVLFQHVLSMAAKLTKQGMLISDSKLVALDMLCRKQLLFREKKRKREYRTGTILVWTFCKKCCHWCYLEEQKQRDKGDGGGNRKKHILWIY